MGRDVTSRLLAAAALIALAVLSLVLSADVRSWRTASVTGDAPPRTYLGGVAEGLLGTSDDVTFHRALRLYEVAAVTHLRLDNATQVQTTRAAAQDALAAAAGSGDLRRASQARTLLGILTYGSTASGGAQDQVDSAVADFTDAIKADDHNDAAKFDLELLLRLSAASGTRPGQGLGGGFGRGGHHGAGGGTPGKGY